MAKVSFNSPNLEPSWDKVEVATQYDVTVALNWYNSNKSEKDAALFLKAELKIARNHTTYAWITRMRSRGFIFGENTEAQIKILKDKFEEAVAYNAIPDLDEDGNPVAQENVINLQERIAAKTDQYIGELEGMLDEHGRPEKTFNAYEWFQKNNVKPVHAAKIIEYFRNRAKQMISEVEKYPEYYDKLTKNQIKSILGVMAVIVQDAERISSNASKTRKPRKKKAVSVEKQVSKLKFKEKDDNFKIQSVNPVSVIGSSQLWVFNTKTRKLGVYIAADRGGLGVKGSSIVNYAEKPISKTLRKPEKVLTEVLDGGKIILRKLMDSINAKESPLNGKINKDVILLRVVP
jgi:hypothetical protein